MSFSKAKIHRFNDAIPCAPPPGTYNPATINKSVGPIINKCERFADGKDLFSSSESLNTLIEDETRTPFKTPRVPESTSKFEMKRSLSQRKACSTEFIYKKHDRYYEVNSLKNSLNEVQEELALERNKTNNLIKEVEKLKEKDYSSEVIVTFLNEKLNIIALLEEKCSVFENISTKSFESYYNHIIRVYSLFQTNFEEWEASEKKFNEIFNKYDELISNYETYFENISEFLSQLIRKRENSIDCQLPPQDRILELEKERRKYELIVQQMQKVINVLSDRVLESDEEVEKLSLLITVKEEDIRKFVAKLQEKDNEIESLKTVINNVAANFLDEVQTTEKDLLRLVDLLKEKALTERKIFEKQVQDKNSIISKLQVEKSQKELQLQESLDLIETLKCKVETSQKILEQVKDENLEIKSTLEGYQQRGNFYDENYLDNNELNVTFTKDVSKKLNMPKETQSFVQHIFELAAEVDNDNDKANALYDIVQNENFLNCMPVEISKENLKNPKLLENMLNLVFKIFLKFSDENNTLRTNSNRLRNDFVEKCDECAQLTQLLQVSEKRVEFYEIQNNQLETSKTELEKQVIEQKTTIEHLQAEKFSMEEKLTELTFETKNSEVMIATLGEELASLRQQPNNEEFQKFINLENSLKETQNKLRIVEKENSRLNKLVTPYRQTLEKYEAESKFLSSKDDCPKKFAKLLEQQNNRQKLKEITKLRTDIVQLRKKNDQLQSEINKYKKVCSKPGKENKGKKTVSEKLPPPTNPVNFTYVITSPKVNRI